MSPAMSLALILIALALGTFSSLLFAIHWLTGSSTQLSTTLLLILVAAVFLTVFARLRRRVPVLRGPVEQRIFRFLPVGCLLLGIAYAAFSLVPHAKRLPHGGWDAMAVWNLHARFLYRGNAGAWVGIFDPSMSASNRDYPLLLPNLVSGAWIVTGGERSVVPLLLGITFAVLTLGILCTAVSALSRDGRGWAAGLMLLATPIYLLSSVFQMADIPIGTYLLTTVALLQFAEAWPDIRKPALFLAGLSAGLVGWTKNEGMLFIAALLTSQIVVFACFPQWKELRTRLSMLAAGLAPMAAVMLAFRALLSTANNPIQRVANVTSPQRYVEIVGGFYEQVKGFGATWHSGGVHPVVLIVMFLLLYASTANKVNPTSLSLILTLVFMFGGYFLIYLFSAYPSASAYVEGSLDRLLLQLWAAFLFILSTFSLSPATDGFNK